MNILHISTAKTWRGGERQTYFLIDGQCVAGHNVFLMSPHRSILSERSVDTIAAFIRYKSGLHNLWSNILNLANFCVQHNINIVHAHDSHAHTLLHFTYTFQRFSVKSVVTRRLIRSIRKSSKPKYNNAQISSLVSISKAVKSAMEPSITNVDRLQVVYSGIDLSDRKAAVRSLSQDTMTIGYVAAFTSEKDHKTFIATAKILLKRYDGYRFLLVGDGPLRSEVEALVIDHKQYFTFTGFVDDVRPCYEKIDILLHTANDEALGTSIMDAMIEGIPTVANAVGGIPEVVANEENGYLCTQGSPEIMADKIENLRQNPQLYHSMSVEALAKAIQFDKQVMVKNYEELYQRLLDELPS